MGTTTQPTMRTGQLSGVLGWALCLVAVLQLARADNIRDFDHMNGDGAHTRVFQHLDRNNDGVVSFKEGTNFGITKQHLMYYSKGKSDRGITYQEFIPLWRERTLYRKANFDGPDPVGHMQPLDKIGKSLGSIDVISGPMEPKEFWKKYVEGHRPALFKGVDAKSIAAQKWTEEYVDKNFGWVDLKIEPKLESRGDESILGPMPHRMNISDFLRRAKQENIYAVSVMPQAMAWDVNIPAAMQCGSRTKQLDPMMKKLGPHPFPHEKGLNWLTHIYEANLWLSQGRTRSQLHYDRENNVNCAYYGKKKWIMIDTRKHFHDITWVRGGRFNGEDDLLTTGTDWVPVDPDHVDLRIHNKMQNIEFYEFTQEVGDCVFIPYSMLHYVNKTNTDHHVAASWMFLPNEVYDEEACAEAPKDKLIPMAAHDILWYYAGQGVIPQGYPAVDREVRDQIINIMRESDSKYFDREVMKEWLSRGESPLKDNRQEREQFWREFSSHAKNPKRGLTREELRWPNTPLSLWLRFSARGDPEGMLPCDDGKYYIPRPSNETEKTDKYFDEILGNKAQDEL